MTDPHTCHATQCTTTVPRRMFMCRKHWAMVPLKLQRKVWAAYVPGQEHDMSKVSTEYLRVTRKAIRRVARQEGLW